MSLPSAAEQSGAYYRSHTQAVASNLQKRSPEDGSERESLSKSVLMAATENITLEQTGILKGRPVIVWS